MAAVLLVLSAPFLGKPAQAASSMVDISAALGLNKVQETYSIHPLDTNNDGNTDKIFMVYHDQAGVVYTYANGKFDPQAVLPTKNPLTNKVEDRHQCTWFDYDQDGIQDIACAAGRGMPSYFIKDADRDNVLFHGQADGTYTEVGTIMGVGDAYGRGRNQITIDANNDGWVDLFTLNEVSPDIDTEPSLNVNHLFINVANEDGTRAWKDSPEYGLNLQVGHGRCGEAFDWNNDGWQDLIICTAKGPVLYANNTDGTFRDATTEAGLSGIGDVGDMKLVDMNNDGKKDLLMMAWSKVVTRIRNGDNTFAPASTVGAFGSGGFTVAAGDYNADGLVDVYAMRTTSSSNDLPDYLYFAKPGGGYSPALTIPAAPGTQRGSDAETIHIPTYKCDIVVVQNGFEEPNGTTAAYVMPGCETPVVGITNLKLASGAVNATTVVKGNPFTLSWTTQNATTCTLNDGLGTSVVVPTNATSYGQTVNEDRAYILSCDGFPGPVSRTLSITAVSVEAGFPIITSFTSDTAQALAGVAFKLKWTTTNADNCTLKPDGLAPIAVSASSNGYAQTITKNTPYTLACSNGYASGSKTLTVAVAPTVIKSFSASATRVKKGTKVTFTWATTSASKCNFYRSTNPSAATVVPVNGSYSEGVWANTTFTLKCQNDNGSSTLVQKTLNVTVY